jgi:hypothetical protein
MAPSQPSEAEIIFSRASVALAKSQRLIASWLPPPTDEELRNTKSEEELEREEAEIFKAEPELYDSILPSLVCKRRTANGGIPSRLGLGAPIPQEIKDGDYRRNQLGSNDKLLKQLLGNGYKKKMELQGKTATGLAPAGVPKPMPQKKDKVVEEDEDDEGGRSALGRSKRKKPATKIVEDGDGVTVESKPILADTTSEPRPKKKKTSSYLDEILEQKARKKKKKKGPVSSD